jgi:hypothetical protein
MAVSHIAPNTPAAQHDRATIRHAAELLAPEREQTPVPDEEQGERYETTVHDKRTGHPVSGRDGDYIQRAEAAEARATQLEAEFGHLRDQPIIYGSEAKKAAEAEARATQAEEDQEKRLRDFLSQWGLWDHACDRYDRAKLHQMHRDSARATQAEADAAYWMKRATDVEFPSPPEGEKDG